MYYTVIKHSGHVRTLEKCRKHSPAARVVYISLVFSNARRVLSQCNTRLRLLYLLNIYVIDQARGQDGWIMAEFSFYVFMDRDEVSIHKDAKTERGQYLAILTETSLVNKRFIIRHKEY